MLENIVAVNLRRKYGEECYFFKTPKAEVDFYVPEQSLAVQVSYSISDAETRKREVAGLMAIANYLNARDLVIVTKDDEETIDVMGKKIDVIPLWKWLLGK